MVQKTASKPEYAKMRGVTRQAVDAAIKSGRIADAVMEDGKLDVDLADQLWAKNTNPISGEHGRIRKGRKNSTEELVEAAIEIGVDPDALPSISESQTLKLAYQAKLAQLPHHVHAGQPGANDDHVEIELRCFSHVVLSFPCPFTCRIGARDSGAGDVSEFLSDFKTNNAVACGSGRCPRNAKRKERSLRRALLLGLVCQSYFVLTLSVTPKVVGMPAKRAAESADEMTLVQ